MKGSSASEFMLGRFELVLTNYIPIQAGDGFSCWTGQIGTKYTCYLTSSSGP